MSADEQIPTLAATAIGAETDTNIVDEKRSSKVLKAKELYSHGSRNYLVKSYTDAVDELSQVCTLYEELYGELSDELGMPYLLYAKSLIALAVDENKVIDVPDEEVEDDDVDDEDDDDVRSEETNGAAVIEATSSSTNGKPTDLDMNAKNGEAERKKREEADSTEDGGAQPETSEGTEKVESTKEKKVAEDEQVSSSADAGEKELKKREANGAAPTEADIVMDGEKPSTSNGESLEQDESEDDNEIGSSLQLAWEILELAAKIFKRQGMSGLSNLAEVHTELGNIEFENNILNSAREDYEKALKIYGELPEKYRRAKAELHYKIGLTYLMDGLNKNGAESLKEACHLLEGEIEAIKAKGEITDNDKNNVQDIEETKQEIWAKIAEIEEMHAQQYAEVRAALDNLINPISSEKTDDAGPSTSAAASSTSISSTKATDISHLVKRKKPEEPTSEAEAVESPAKRPAV